MNTKIESAQLRHPYSFRWLFVLVSVFLLARYAAAPMTGFVLDDWNYLRYAGMYPDGWELAREGFAKDLNRPLSTMVMALGFYKLGLTLWPYMLLLILGHLLSLLLATALIHRWNGGDPRGTFLFGVLYAVLPLLTESFYFPMLAFVMAVVGIPLYLLSAYGITRFGEGGRTSWLWIAWLSYGVNLFWYEAGILLPAAFAVLLVGRVSWGRFVLAMGGYAVFFFIYFAWRSTEAFGLLQSTTPEHMKASSTGLETIVFNAKELIRWWVADRGLAVWSKGLLSFVEISSGKRFVLVSLNLLAVFSVGNRLLRLLRRRQETPETQLSLLRILCVCAVWFVVTSVPALMSYVVGRLLVLPAVAACCALTLLLVRLKPVSLLVFGGPILFFALMVDQGTNKSWRDVGQAYWGVYEGLREQRPDWVDREVLLFDSQGILEQRPDLDPVQAVAFHGNASMFRGSGLREMIWLAGRIWPKAKGRLDVEYRAEFRGDELILHRRFDPEQRELERIPLEEVYVFDLAEAAGFAD